MCTIYLSSPAFHCRSQFRPQELSLSLPNLEYKTLFSLTGPEMLLVSSTANVLQRSKVACVPVRYLPVTR